MSMAVPRQVHPGAWWVWALGLASAASSTSNPVLLALALAVTCLVVTARRGTSPWARAFRLYLYLGAAIVGLRMLLHILVGLKFGAHEVLPLPSIALPSWAAGIDLGGTVYLEGLLAAAIQGLRLATMIACVGAANALANPKRLLRTLPGALHEVGTTVVVSVTVAPQLAESVQRVMRARQLRGETSGGVRAVPRVALPVLQDTLDRSLLLASSMDSRGYGRRGAETRRARRLTAALTLGGLLGGCIGIYGMLDSSAPRVLGVPLLVAGLGLGGAGLWLGGRSIRRSSYRPDPWSLPEWLTAGSGLAAAAALLISARIDPGGLAMPLEPLGFPPLPLLPAVGLLLAALPAVATPLPPRPLPRVSTRHTEDAAA